LINIRYKALNYVTMSLPSFLKPETSYDLVRVGKDNDGGYLAEKNSIYNSKYLISLGIFDDWSFEKIL